MRPRTVSGGVQLRLPDLGRHPPEVRATSWSGTSRMARNQPAAPARRSGWPALMCSTDCGAHGQAIPWLAPTTSALRGAAWVSVGRDHARPSTVASNSLAIGASPEATPSPVHVISGGRVGATRVSDCAPEAELQQVAAETRLTVESRRGHPPAASANLRCIWRSAPGRPWLTTAAQHPALGSHGRHG